MKRFWHDESGATAIEYALIAAFVALTIIAGLRSIGGTLSNRLTNIATTMNNGGS